MIASTYSLTFTDAERQDVARVMGMFVGKLANAHVVIEDLSRAGIAPSNITIPPAQSPMTGQSTPAVAAPTAPIEVRDRWAKDRKGKELPNPEGANSREVTLWKVEPKRPRGKPEGSPFLQVTWQSKDRGYVDANCFETTLFPWIVAAHAAGKPIVLHLVRKGKYLNIVGVRA